MLCFQKYSSESFQTDDVTFNVIGIDGIRYAACDILLVFHCNYRMTHQKVNP